MPAVEKGFNFNTGSYEEPLENKMFIDMEPVLSQRVTTSSGSGACGLCLW